MFNKNAIIYLAFPIEYPKISLQKVAIIFNVLGWLNLMAYFNNINICNYFK